MERFYYDLIYDDQNHMEVNVLFADDAATAFEFFDGLFLELHLDATRNPNTIRLRTNPDEEEIARFDMHYDAIA